MNKYNLDKLVKVKVNNFYRSRFYTYKTPKKFLWFTVREEGVYRNLFSEYIGMQIPRNHVIIDGVLFEIPEVILSFQGEKSTIKYFDTMKKAEDYANSLTQGKNWLLN